MVSLILLMLWVVGLDSGASVRKSDIHWFTKSERELLRKSACWKCGKLAFCTSCKVVECILGLPLGKAVCASRVVGEVVRV
jgi:hypothetical protein